MEEPGRSRRSQPGTQTAARMMTYSGVEGERSHGGVMAKETMRMTCADGGGNPSGDGELMGQHDTDGSEDQGKAAAMSVRDKAKVPED